MLPALRPVPKVSMASSRLLWCGRHLPSAKRAPTEADARNCPAYCGFHQCRPGWRLWSSRRERLTRASSTEAARVKGYRLTISFDYRLHPEIG